MCHKLLKHSYLEWISSESTRTSTDSDMIVHLAISTWSTRQLTRIDTLVILTSLIVSAFRIGNTIATNATGVRIAFVSWLAFADWTSTFVTAISIGTANIHHWTRIGQASRPIEIRKYYQIDRIRLFSKIVKGRNNWHR